MTSGDILFERRGAAGLVTLNRPQALNAVSLVMVRALTRQLAVLNERLQEAEASAPAAANEPPPHY